jgi:hypothetical protein
MQQPGEIEAESGRDRERHSPTFADILLGRFSKKISKFSKNPKMLEIA